MMRHQVVGVVANAYFGDLRNPPDPMVYVPLEGSNYFALYMRSPLDLGSVARLVLAAIGLFGLLNYSVARRTKEIGIRVALGGRRDKLIFLVLKDLFGMVGGGLLAGLAGSLAVMTLLRSLLFGIRPVDPAVLGTAAAVFLIAAFVAGGLPAMRATTVDPMIALRRD